MTYKFIAASLFLTQAFLSYTSHSEATVSCFLRAQTVHYSNGINGKKIETFEGTLTLTPNENDPKIQSLSGFNKTAPIFHINSADIIINKFIPNYTFDLGVEFKMIDSQKTLRLPLFLNYTYDSEKINNNAHESTIAKIYKDDTEFTEYSADITCSIDDE